MSDRTWSQPLDLAGGGTLWISQDNGPLTTVHVTEITESDQDEDHCVFEVDQQQPDGTWKNLLYDQVLWEHTERMQTTWDLALVKARAYLGLPEEDDEQPPTPA